MAKRAIPGRLDVSNACEREREREGGFRASDDLGRLRVLGSEARSSFRLQQGFEGFGFGGQAAGLLRLRI